MLEGADCGGLAGGLCLYRPTGYGPGDWGRCAATCQAHDDCANPQLWCRYTTYAPVGSGYCIQFGNGTECPTGTECDALMDPQGGYEWQCVQTSHGPYCLETDPANGDELVFPLAGGMGGAGGAGGGSSTGGTGGSGGGTGGN
jgi:hypothetical protein